MKTQECHSPCDGEAVWYDDPGVYVCETCGRIGDPGFGLFTGGRESDFIRFVGTVTMFASDYHVGPWVVVKSPYEAKDAIKSLDEEKTGRMWDADMSCWLIKESAKARAKANLKQTEFGVIDFTDNE